MAGTEPQVLSCPNCGGEVQLRAAGQSLSVTCSRCQSVLDATDPSYHVLSSFQAAQTHESLIKLGTRGKLLGETFEVIGFLRRADSTGAYEWDEYLLFNPMKGFRWLVQSQGHWSVVKTTKTTPKTHRRYATFLGKTYHLFLRDTTRVIYVAGEFYWKVAFGEKVQVEEYVNPPEVLSCEKSKVEIVWSVGTYVEPATVAAAFGPGMTLMPPRVGVAPGQPSPVDGQVKKVLTYMAVVVAALFVLQVQSCATADKTLLFTKAYDFERKATSNVVVTEPFEVPPGVANLEVALKASTSNSWISTKMSLINAMDSAAIAFEQGVEFYHGVAGGESWSEGGASNEVILSAVRGGSYYLTIEPSVDATVAMQRYEVTVRRDVATWSNFWWALLLVLPWPAIQYLRHKSHDKLRWSTSDFADGEG